MTRRRRAGRTAARRAAASAGERLPARPAGADQGRAGAATRAPRPVRDRALARARRHAPRLRAGVGAAQRADRPAARRARLTGNARRLGRATGGGRARADGRPARRRSSSPPSTFADVCERLGLDGEPAIAYRPRSRAATPAELAAELRERARRRPRARLHRPRPAPRRPCDHARGPRRCAPTARRASSDSACSRCCWPSGG